MAVKVKQAAE